MYTANVWSYHIIHRVKIARAAIMPRCDIIIITTITAAII